MIEIEFTIISLKAIPPSLTNWGKVIFFHKDMKDMSLWLQKMLEDGGYVNIEALGMAAKKRQ